MESGEKAKKRAWACLHVCCVELVKLVLRQGGIWKGIQQRQKVHSKERPMLEGTNKLHSSWERARARRNCQILFTLLFLPKLGLYTCSYNYSKYPAFSSSTNMKRVPPKQIFGLYLVVLTSRIMDNEKNNWGHRGKGDNEENKATTHSSYCILWINAISPFTNMNTSAHVKPVAFPGFNLSYSATEVDSFLCLWV